MPVGPAAPPLHHDHVPTTGTPTGPVTFTAPPPTPAEPREYIVFGDATEPGQETRWQEVGRASATTKAAARDEIVDKLPENERAGPFVTVAASAWKPQTAKEVRDVRPGLTTIRRVWS